VRQSWNRYKCEAKVLPPLGDKLREHLIWESNFAFFLWGGHLARLFIGFKCSRSLPLPPANRWCNSWCWKWLCEELSPPRRQRHQSRAVRIACRRSSMRWSRTSNLPCASFNSKLIVSSIALISSRLTQRNKGRSEKSLVWQGFWQRPCLSPDRILFPTTHILQLSQSGWRNRVSKVQETLVITLVQDVRLPILKPMYIKYLAF